MQTLQRLTCLTAVAVFGASALNTNAQTPMGTSFTYQGQLKDSSGKPVTDSVDMNFELFDASTGGNSVSGTYTIPSVQTDNGLFTATVDFGADAFVGDARWLEITVCLPGQPATCETLVPRQKVTPVPNAVYASTTGNVWWAQLIDMPLGFQDDVDDDHLASLTCADGAVAQYHEIQGWECGSRTWHLNGSNIYYDFGNVGIGTDTPTHRLTIASATSDSLRIIGPEGDFGYKGRINFGDSNYTYIEEDEDDQLTIYASRIALQSGRVGIRTNSPTHTLDVVGDARIDGPTFRVDAINDRVGIGTEAPTEKLHVIGGATFGLGTGNVNVTTPGGHPGIITYATSGNRRDIIMGAAGVRILANDSSSPPAADRGLTVSENGWVGIFNVAPSRELDVKGTARVEVLEVTGADLAEKFPFSEEVQPGMVVAIDADFPGRLCLSRHALNKRVAGVIAGANDFSTGIVLGSSDESDGIKQAVALSGRVWVNCDATETPIEAGDLLTTSHTPGHAMAVVDHTSAHGAILGKAMTSLQNGKGMVLVLVTLQ